VHTYPCDISNRRADKPLDRPKAPAGTPPISERASKEERGASPET
jgi:hypothetical protein